MDTISADLQTANNNDNRIKLAYKIDESGVGSFWFNLATDSYYLYNCAVNAATKHGTIISRVNGCQFRPYHRLQGYRDYMLWVILPESADINAFCSDMLNRKRQTIYDKYGRVVGILDLE